MIPRPVFVTSRPDCAHSPHDPEAPPEAREDGGDACPACSFQVAWKINPHMKVGGARRPLALVEHREFRQALREAGAAVFELPFVHGAFDSVFVKDNAVLTTRAGRARALMARPKCEERRGEQADRALALEDLGFEVTEWAREDLEGGDLAVAPDAPAAFLGYGFRSARAAAPQLSRYLGLEVTPLELVDPYFYHVDTALALLRGGTALAYRGAFSEASWQALGAAPGIQRLIPVARREAMAFGLNCIEVGDQVVIGSEVPQIAGILARLGKRPVVAPLSQYQLAGGSSACLAAPVHCLDRISASAPAPRWSEHGRDAA